MSSGGEKQEPRYLTPAPLMKARASANWVYLWKADRSKTSSIGKTVETPQFALEADGCVTSSSCRGFSRFVVYRLFLTMSMLMIEYRAFGVATSLGFAPR